MTEELAAGDLPPPRDLKALCIDLEHYETDAWAVRAILQHEICTATVVDPCAGTGVLAKEASRLGYNVVSFDIHDWGFPLTEVVDFLSLEKVAEGDFTVLVNPPFSLAVEFIEKAFELGARKVICFQRLAFWESRGRREFWQKYPPNRIYICGDRATCWRHDLPAEERGSGSTTAHAWYVFERGHPSGTVLGHIYKEKANGR